MNGMGRGEGERGVRGGRGEERKEGDLTWCWT